MNLLHLRTLSRFRTPATRASGRQLQAVGATKFDSGRMEHYAYLGDGLYTLFIRNRYISPPKSLTNYHQACMGHSAAESQAYVLDALTFNEKLTEDEKAMTEMVFSSSRSFRQRFTGSEEKQILYNKATALEALLGFLHQTNPERLEEVLESCGAVMDKR